MQQLSSSGTIFHKVVFPALWLGGFGFGAIAVALGADISQPPWPAGIMLPLMLLGGFGLCWWKCFPLKHVWLGDAVFHVEGLSKRIQIPFSNIESVEVSRFSRPEVITLVLRSPSELGRHIQFTPSMRMAKFSPHPTFTMLSDMFNPKRQMSPPHRKEPSQQVAQILAFPTTDKMPAVAWLDDVDLDELIDRLAHNSELRDLAREERQRRWRR